MGSGSIRAIHNKPLSIMPKKTKRTSPHTFSERESRKGAAAVKDQHGRQSDMALQVNDSERTGSSTGID